MDSEHIASNFFLVLFIVAAAIVAFVFFPYLNAITLAIVFAVIFTPVYRRLRGLMPKYESFAAFISVLIAFIVVLVPLIFFGIAIFKEVQGLYANLSSGGYSLQLADLAKRQLSNIFPSTNIDFSQYAKTFLNWLIMNIGPIFSQLAGITITILLSLFALYYFLKDGCKIYDSIVRLSPLKKEDMEKILDKLDEMAGAVIKGSLVVAVLQGIIVGIGFYLFGLPNPVLWGSVAVICALVPLIGVAIVVLPTAVLMWLSGSAGLVTLGFLIWGLMLPGTIDNFLRPRIINRGAHVNQALVLFSVIGGIATFGPAGFILGPLALILLLTLIGIYPSIIKSDKQG